MQSHLVKAKVTLLSYHINTPYWTRVDLNLTAFSLDKDQLLLFVFLALKPFLVAFFTAP